jgi:LysM repeat protein
MKNFSRLILTLIFAVSSTAGAGPQGNYSREYIVQVGDSLSEIADRVRGGHTYGKGENLEKILLLNPQLDDDHPIFVGQKILVPVNDLRSVANDETVAPPAKAMPVQSVATPAATPVASPAVTPVPAVAPLAEEEDVAHRFEVKAGYQFSTLSAQDNVTKAKADLNTDHDLTAALNWSQQWNERFKTLFSFSLRNLEFQPSTNSAKKINSDSKTLYGIGFGGHYLLSDKFALDVGARYGQELFLHGLSTTSIAIDTANVSAFSLGLDYRIFKKGSTSLGIAVAGSYLGGTSTDSYTIDSGSAYKGLLYIRRDKNGKLLAFEIGAQQRNQNTSVSDLNETTVFGNVIFGFDLFREEK